MCIQDKFKYMYTRVKKYFSDKEQLSVFYYHYVKPYLHFKLYWPLFEYWILSILIQNTVELFFKETSDV